MKRDKNLLLFKFALFDEDGLKITGRKIDSKRMIDYRHIKRKIVPYKENRKFRD